MRILLLGHGHFKGTDPPSCLPFRTTDEWHALVAGNEVIMVDNDPWMEPDLVMDLSKPWTVPEPVDVIVDSMGPIAARFVQTEDFVRSAFHALNVGGRMHVWVCNNTTMILEKTSTKFVKIDRSEPVAPSPRVIPPHEMLHYLWLTKLTIPPSVRFLPDVTCCIFGDGRPFFTIECEGLLRTKDPLAKPTDYLWRVTGVNPDLVRSVSIVNCCDHGEENFAVTRAVRAYNGKLSYENPKRVYFDGDSSKFAGEFNSFVTFQVETYTSCTIEKWTAEYTGYCGQVEVSESSVEK